MCYCDDYLLHTIHVICYCLYALNFKFINIANALREPGRVEGFERGDLTSLLRTFELRLKKKMARTEGYPRRVRGTTSQHGTDTLSRCTQRNIVKRRSENLRMCPKCNGDDQ